MLDVLCKRGPMTRTVRFHETGGPEVLRLDELEAPVPGPSEVVIDVAALGINRAEVDFRKGEYVVDPVLPSGIGYEAAGTVREVGSDVDHVAVGDAVSVVPAFQLTEYGVHGEVVVAPGHAVVKHPADLSWEEAAAVWMPYVTAYGGLIDIAGLSAGETVLLNAASSSVGLAAIQVARSVGATPVAVTRTAAKRQALLDAGASFVIVTDEEDLVSRARDLTDGTGARVVFDPVGGPGFADFAAAAAPHGTMILYGLLSDETTPLSVPDVLGKYLTVRGYQLFEVTNDEARRRAAVNFVLRGLADGSFRPAIDRTFALNEIAEAHRYMEAGGQVGKIVVTVP